MRTIISNLDLDPWQRQADSASPAISLHKGMISHTRLCYCSWAKRTWYGWEGQTMRPFCMEAARHSGQSR